MQEIMRLNSCAGLIHLYTDIFLNKYVVKPPHVHVFHLLIQPTVGYDFHLKLAELMDAELMDTGCLLWSLNVRGFCIPRGFWNQ